MPHSTVPNEISCQTPGMLYSRHCSSARPARASIEARAKWLCLRLALAISLLASPARADTDNAALQAEFSRKIQPLLKKYCFECHGRTAPQAGIDLTRYQTPRDIFEGRRQWSIALAK